MSKIYSIFKHINTSYYSNRMFWNFCHIYFTSVANKCGILHFIIFTGIII